MPNNLYLVGPMGAGKTTIGRQLARLLNVEFKDSDQEIEVRSGANIAWIFDVEGEEGFRQRETQVIDEMTQLPNIILATGGGAVIRAENRRLLKTRGTAIYLKTSIDQQLTRTVRDRSRPLLQVGDPRETLTKLMAIRDPLYQDVADIVIDTDRRRPKTVAMNIIKALDLTDKITNIEQ